MTERERWIVYPLLFLALGAALRDKLSEHTKTKSIECQELTVYGEDGPNQPPVPLVQIGAVKRTSADSPHVGQIFVNGQLLVNGMIHTQGLQSEAVQAGNVNADNYYFRRVPFAPGVLRSIPGVSPADWLRAQQQAAAAEEEAKRKEAEKESENEESEEQSEPPAENPAPKTQSDSTPAASTPAE